MQSNWTEYALEDLLSYEQPTPYIVESTDYSDNYKTPVLTAGKSFIMGYTNETNGIYDKLPVIIFDDFTTSTQYVNFPFKVKSSAMKILTANTDLVLPKFIFYRMQIIEFDHSTHKRYWIQQYSKIKVKIPSLPEQEKIVAKIEELFSELDNGVETLKKTKQQLAVYRQAVLKEAFEGKFTAHIPCGVDLLWASEEETKSLPTIPQEWRYIALSNLGDLGRGKSKHRPRNDPKLFEGGKYPFLQTGEVKAAKQYITEYSKMYGEFGLQQSKLWPKGTLCITIAANIAETAFLGIDACFPDSVVGFTPYEYILPEYIKHFIESQKLRLWAFAPATAQKNINLDTLENLIVPYCSLEEQKNVISEIEARMTICDNIEKTVDTALQQAEAMRQSILKKHLRERYKMNECEHLINNYFYENQCVIHYGFHSISESDLNLALNNLNYLNPPDMYAELDDKIIIIEHFEFDASKRTRKGMEGKKEEALLKQRIFDTPVDNKFHIDKGNYKISLENWQSNFDDTFNSHYKRIPKYKESICDYLKISDSKPIIVGFFIENQYSPIVYDETKIGELYYFDTIQFANKITNSQELDFVLFGSNYKGHPQIFYFDRGSFDVFQPPIDLTNLSINLSPINESEITIYGSFQQK